MYNPATRMISNTRDVRWLEKTYSEYIGTDDDIQTDGSESLTKKKDASSASSPEEEKEEKKERKKEEESIASEMERNMI